MDRTQWLWMRASVALMRAAAVAMRSDAAALPPGAPADGRLPVAVEP